MTLDIHGIMRLLPHRYPFLMIDRVEELEPGVSAVGVKCVSVNEPHFAGHFPGQPIMPGVLIAEAFAQVAAVVALAAHPEAAGGKVYLMGLDELRFRRPVMPGDTLRLKVVKEAEKMRVWRFDCRAEVDGQRVATGKVLATIAADPPPGA